MKSRADTVSKNAIQAAQDRIVPHIRKTPVMEIAGSEIGHGTPVSLKLELFQHTGSFKPRGAFNNLLSKPVPAAGVAAASGGNHGAAVAYAAARLGHPAHIFVPEISAPVKIARIEAAGASVHVGGARYADALAHCESHQAETGAIGVHAYDDPATIAGQGTVALEWQSQAPDLDTVLISVGGAGLISGIAAWHGGSVKVVGVEPEGAPTLHAALAAGQPVDVEINSLAADSLGARSVGDINHALCARFVDHVALVSDEAIANAQAFLWTRLQIAAEPGGATAMAALLAGAYRPQPGERVGVLVCGGNIDPAMLVGHIASL
jgi:threonine dehydratase